MKDYIVVHQVEEDSPSWCTIMTADEVRAYAKEHGQDTFWLIDGTIIKSEHGKIDLTKL